MLFKANLYRVFCLILVAASLVPEVKAYCSLEKMKKFAMEACEHLFLMDEPREKRSLSHRNLETFGNNIRSFGIPEKKHLHYNMRRSNYPLGGYLKVDHSYFIRLTQVDVLPRYKARHIKMKDLERGEDTKERFKRDHLSLYNNIPYCCYNECDEDFFC